MQTVTSSLSTSIQPRRNPGFLARVIRFFTGRVEVREPSRMAWTNVRPVDFDGEDTSLTEAHLRRLR